MTPEEFVTWFKGFVQAANPYNITPKQWEDVKDKLESVEVEEYIISEEDENLTTYGDWYVSTTDTGSFDIIYYTKE